MHFREPEIQHLHIAVRGDLDIGGLQIAMNDPLLVGGFQRFSDLPGDLQRLAQGESAARDAIGQRRALDQFENQPAHALAVFQPVNRTDMRMIQ